jgi:hypothetical protein
MTFMKSATKFLTLPALLWIAQTLFAAYPRDYPIYLGLLGFQKSEIEHLRGGGMVTHSVLNKAPGEFGVSAARVFNVPVYYFRDYYRYVENYRTIFRFEAVGKFHAAPTIMDLRALRFTGAEIDDFLDCKIKNCDMKLSAGEIALIPNKKELKGDEGRETASNAYRQILLNRLLSYQENGTTALGKYEDGGSVDDPAAIAQAHLAKFEHLEAYFPGVIRYLKDYPNYKDSRIDDFFYWTREHLGNKPVISIRHVITRRIGEDYLIVNRQIYSNHYYLSSIAVMHLINYADAISPWTLFVYQQRTLTDLNGIEGFGRNILRSNLERNVNTEFKAVGKEMEERYKTRNFANYPFGLLPRDQR